MTYQEFREQLYKDCKNPIKMLDIANQYLNCKHDKKIKLIVSCYAKWGMDLEWVNREVRSSNLACSACVMAKENKRPLFVEDALQAHINIYYLV